MVVKSQPQTPDSFLEPQLPVFNRAALMQRVMDDEELARVVIEGFLEDMPEQILTLKKYVEAGEFGHIQNQAHKIKGASATLGGEALRALAAALEQACLAGDLKAIATRTAQLDAQFLALQAALQK